MTNDRKITKIIPALEELSIDELNNVKEHVYSLLCRKMTVRRKLSSRMLSARKDLHPLCRI